MRPPRPALRLALWLACAALASVTQALAAGDDWKRVGVQTAGRTPAGGLYAPAAFL